MDAHQKAIRTLVGVLVALVVWLSPAASAAPLRIVSIVPAATEMLFAIGAGPDVVGVSSFDHYPAAVEKITRVGGLLDPNVERILQLKPDLVIVYGAKSDLAQKLDRAHIATYAYQTGDLANITSTIRALGKRTGRETGAEAEATRIERGLDAIKARVAGQPRPKTLLVFGREPGSLRGVYASGGVGFLHDMLALAGGDDVFAEVKKENVQISAEQILARAPEVVLELHGTRAADRIDAERRVWSVLPSLPAVRQQRVQLLIGEWLMIPGPRIVEATKVFADALHPLGR